MKIKTKLLFIAAFIAVTLPLMFAGNASAMFMEDGARPNGSTGGWTLPSDMVCILGVHTNGNLDVVAGITNSRDCIYYNTGLTGLNPVDVTASTGAGSICGASKPCNVKANCSGTSPVTLGTLTWNSTSSKCYDSAPCTVAGFAGGSIGGITFPNANDGAKHALATSICVSGSAGLSLKGLDRTAQMCAAKGGTWQQTSATAPSGFAGTFPTANYGGSCVAYGRQFAGEGANGTPLAFGGKGTTQGTGTGYCYTTMNMTTAYNASTCPAADSTSSSDSTYNGGLTGVTPNSGYNSSSAYDWTWTGTLCTYAKGIKGYPKTALTKVDGSTVSTSTNIDLSTKTTMGDCLATGGSWSNWTGQAVSTTTINTSPVTSTIPAWDYTKQAPDADAGCLHCHSSSVEYNGPAEREKDSYVKTGHKNMLRKVTAGQAWAGADGTVYTTDGTNAINFMSPSDPFAKVTIGGIDQNLYYIYGDWMIALPSLVTGTNGYGPVIGATNGYSCYACHATGASDTSGSVPGVQSIGTPGYKGAEPLLSFPGIILNGATNTTDPRWNLEGIQCARCHNASVGVVTATQIAGGGFTTTQPTSGGMGALAGSNQSRTSLCFGCHQSMAKLWPGMTNNSGKGGVTLTGTSTGTTQYDPTLIPTGINHGAAAGRDFNGHVLGNSFLNSPHARFSGTVVVNSLGKFDLQGVSGSGGTYNSLFKGYTCWQGPTSNSPAKTADSTGAEIGNKTQCEALYGAGSWRADNGDPTQGTQGTCATCHDVHNSMFVASQSEAAMRKTCDDCHVNNSTISATDALAPQVVPASINHLTGTGTPFDTTLYDTGACVVCHMATQAETNGNQNSMPVHLWRISTDPNYNTFPTSNQFYGSGGATINRNAQTAADGAFTQAAWVDLDLACGQCHGGSLGSGATANSAPYYSKTDLAAVAQGMHDSAGVNYATNFSFTSINGLTVGVGATVNCGGACPTLNYDWNWGDGTLDTSGITFATTTHPYSLPGTYKVKLTVSLASSKLNVGSYTQTVTLTTPAVPLAAGATCTWNANTWSMHLVDATTGGKQPLTSLTINWGDNMKSYGTATGQTFDHTYAMPGTYTVTDTAVDSNFTSNTFTCAAGGPYTATYFNIGGIVKNHAGTVNLSSATVKLYTTGGTYIGSVVTGAPGTFTFGLLKPGSYNLYVTRPGYTFNSPAQTGGPIIVGGDKLSNTINSLQ